MILRFYFERQGMLLTGSLRVAAPFWFYHCSVLRAVQFRSLEGSEESLSSFLNGRPENASGSVVACSMEGTRPILVEIQVLVCQSNFGIPRRTV